MGAGTDTRILHDQQLAPLAWPEPRASTTHSVTHVSTRVNVHTSPPLQHQHVACGLFESPRSNMDASEPSRACDRWHEGRGRYPSHALLSCPRMLMLHCSKLFSNYLQEILPKEPHSEARQLPVLRQGKRALCPVPPSEAGEVAWRDLRNGSRDAAPGGFWSIHLARMPS